MKSLLSLILCSDTGDNGPLNHQTELQAVPERCQGIQAGLVCKLIIVCKLSKTPDEICLE